MDEEIYENPVNKHLCKTRLITVPEPSEADEDSMGYTKIKEEPETSNIQEIQDKVCHVWQPRSYEDHMKVISPVYLQLTT